MDSRFRRPGRTSCVYLFYNSLPPKFICELPLLDDFSNDAVQKSQNAKHFQSNDVIRFNHVTVIANGIKL